MSAQGPKSSPRLILGVGITVIGVLMLVDTLDFFDADQVVRFWPALLIVLGARVLQRGSRSGRWVGGGMLMLLGSVLLLRELGLVRVGIGQLWPLFIILAGFGILMRGRSAPSTESATDHSSDRISEFAALCALSPRVTSKSFKGGEINAFMGGCEVDLRDADIEGEAVIDVFAMMGGIQLAVPPDWSINAKVTPLMGGLADKTGSTERDLGKQLTLRGFVMMGGIEVIN
jgi:hypothetical protein